MKGELILKDNSELLNYFFAFSLPGKFCLEIGIDDEHTLEKQLKDKEKFDISMNISKQFETTEEIINDEMKKTFEYMIENYDNLFEKIEYIKLDFENIDINKYIRSNPIIQTKKIVLPYELNITDYDKVLELMDEYSDIVDKIYVHFENDIRYVSLLDCYKTMNEIKKYAENIKYLGLSKMETVMYVYDMVRNRVYVSESETEDRAESRDLAKVLFGNKIVCAGYANLFNAILYYLGFGFSVFPLNDTNESLSGHARNVLYIQDEKYNIDGVYFCDATWDSKRFEEDNSYLYSYRFFAKTLDTMNEYDKRVNLENLLSKYSKNMCKEITTLFRKENYEELFKYMTTVNVMIRLTDRENKVPSLSINSIMSSNDNFDTKSFLKGFREVHKLFNKEIPAETMIQILNNVRKAEYAQDSSWYPYTVGDLYETFVNSEWNFKDCYLKGNDLLYKNLGFEIPKEKEDLLNFKGFALENNMFKTIEQVRISKVLKLVLEKRISEQMK